MSEDVKSSVKIGDLVRLQLGYDYRTEPLYSIGVVVAIERVGRPARAISAKVAFLNPPYYQDDYHDPNDDWFYTKNLEVLSEGR